MYYSFELSSRLLSLRFSRPMPSTNRRYSTASITHSAHQRLRESPRVLSRGSDSLHYLCKLRSPDRTREHSVECPDRRNVLPSPLDLGARVKPALRTLLNNSGAVPIAAFAVVTHNSSLPIVVFKCVTHMRTSLPPQASIDAPIIAPNEISAITSSPIDLPSLNNFNGSSNGPSTRYKSITSSWTFSKTQVPHRTIFKVAIQMNDLFPRVVSCKKRRSNQAMYVEVSNSSFERQRYPKISLVIGTRLQYFISLYICYTTKITDRVVWIAIDCYPFFPHETLSKNETKQ